MRSKDSPGLAALASNLNMRASAATAGARAECATERAAAAPRSPAAPRQGWQHGAHRQRQAQLQGALDEAAARRQLAHVVPAHLRRIRGWGSARRAGALLRSTALHQRRCLSHGRNQIVQRMQDGRAPAGDLAPVAQSHPADRSAGGQSAGAWRARASPPCA